MNRDEIKKILPHREPMLLIDEAGIADDGAATGKYTVRGDEWFLQGHFPGNPVVPGVILCEMMGQSSCMLIQTAENECFTPYFTGMNNVKFKGMVRVGDTVQFRCTLDRAKGSFYFIKGEGFVNGKLCVCGELSFAIVKQISEKEPGSCGCAEKNEV